MCKILVTGANGQLGSELRFLTKSDDNFIYTDVAELDITDRSAVADFCEKNSVSRIINCAAYTAVDKAEEESDFADKINHLAVKNLAEVSKEQGIKLVHVSTDYVFDGTNYQPYGEDFTTHPQSVYGVTKLAGEKAIFEFGSEGSIIVRTSWVYSSFCHNFVKTMMRLGNERDELRVIVDQIGTPTYARDLAGVLLQLVNLENDKTEVYHYSNEGVCSWYDFAIAIMEEANIECVVNPITTDQYPTAAKRPHYSVMNKEKIKRDLGIEIPHWRESLKKCLILLKAK